MRSGERDLHSKAVRGPFKLMFHFPEERLCFYGAFSLRARAYRPSDDSSGASATSNAIRGVCRVPFSIDQAAGQARSHATARCGRAGIASSACRAPLAAAPGLIWPARLQVPNPAVVLKESNHEDTIHPFRSVFRRAFPDERGARSGHACPTECATSRNHRHVQQHRVRRRVRNQHGDGQRGPCGMGTACQLRPSGPVQPEFGPLSERLRSNG